LPSGQNVQSWLQQLLGNHSRRRCKEKAAPIAGGLRALIPKGLKHYFVTRKTTLLMRVFLGVVTWAVAVVAPVGTVVLISDFDTTVKFRRSPVKGNAAGARQLGSRIVMVAPTLPEVGTLFSLTFLFIELIDR
jgi:hypothetical protein